MFGRDDKFRNYMRNLFLKNDLIVLEGFGNKSVNNLLESIELSKNNSLEKVLFALGIRHVGKKTAKVLAKRYKDIDALINADIEELTSINDVGEEMYSLFKTWCSLDYDCSFSGHEDRNRP